MQRLSLLRLNMVIFHETFSISAVAPILYRHILCTVYCYDMTITMKNNLL